MKAAQKQLLALLSDGNFCSGRKLSEKLGISRTAVWNYCRELESLGLQIHAVTGKGYRLSSSLELLDQEQIISGLESKTRPSLAGLELHDTLESTNRHLTRLSELGGASGTVCIAESQTGGRGRLGRKWVSPYGRNIYLSLLWRFQSGAAALSGLSLAVGIAVVRALEKEKISGVGLKWPNDIYAENKKLGGILIEITGDTLGPCAVVIGLGLNVDFPNASAKEIDQPWIDINRISKDISVSRNRLVSGLVNELLSLVSDFDQTGFAPLADQWRLYDCFADRQVRLTFGKQTLDGVARGIDNSGLLLFEDSSGQVKAYASGEVSLKLDAGGPF